MSVDDEITRQWQELLDSGAAYLDGVDEEGNFVYALDTDRLREVNPELYHAHMDEVDDAILGLVDKGLVELDFDNPDVGVVLTEKGRQWAEAIAESLEE